MGFFDIFKKKGKDEVAPSFSGDIGAMGDNFALGQDTTSGLGGTADLGAMNSQQPGTIPPTLERIQPNEQQFPANTFPPNTYAPNRPAEPNNDLVNKNIEIISYKIDALKASIESINQRLANIEAIAKGEQEKPKYRW